MINSNSSSRLRTFLPAINALVVVSSLCFAGCGSGNLPTHPVKGKVTFEDGTVPQFGTVEFLNDEHEINARGEIGKDGSFTVSTFNPNDGAVEGKHRIAIIQLTTSPHTARFEHKISHDHGSVVDSIYHDFRTSGLSCEVKPGENEIELTVAKNDDP